MNIEEIKVYLNSKNLTLNNKILDNLKSIKTKAIEINNEELANEVWCLEEIYSIQDTYLRMFSNLKNNNFEKAWNQIEHIDISLYHLKNNCDWILNKFNLSFIENTIHYYEKLFPYEYFMSRESIVKKKRCSICNKIKTIRSHCGHTPGKIYMGELCVDIVEDMEFLAMALVKNPLDKYTVLFPQGLEYNYFMLENLMPNLHSPYDRWYVKTEKIKKNEFKNIGRNDLCPCGSKKKYKKCCLSSENEWRNHQKITLLDNPNAKPINPITQNTWK